MLIFTLSSRGHICKRLAFSFEDPRAGVPFAGIVVVVSLALLETVTFRIFFLQFDHAYKEALLNLEWLKNIELDGTARRDAEWYIDKKSTLGSTRWMAVVFGWLPLLGFLGLIEVGGVSFEERFQIISTPFFVAGALCWIFLVSTAGCSR